MNKTQKRQLNLRNKLFAAIAMLLVSSIMMVSTTYAWFTLSTAPEVQGITTTVGANGNLEIALSPLSGETAGILTGVDDSTKDWVIKNTTWGNLLDMSNAAYELDKIVLQPSQLVFTTAAGHKVDGAGLAYPVYGSDGRISRLDKGTSTAGKVDEDPSETAVTLSKDFQVLANGGYGVRAIGTSSGLTENQRVFNNGVSALRTGMNQASGVASSALNDNGQALANMMVDHAMATKFEGTTENFAQYQDELNALVTSLEKSVENMDAAMKGFLTAYAAAHLTGGNLTTAVTTIDQAESIDGLLESLKNAVDLTVDVEALNNALDARDAIAEKVASARTAFNKISVWDWEGVAGVVNHLMNVDGVEINGMSYAEITATGEDANGIGALVQSIFDNGSTATIELNEGSGIYYDIHKMASKIYASTDMSVDAGKVITGMSVIKVKTIIETSYNGSTVLGMALNEANSMTPKKDDAGAEGADVVKLDVYYGYMLDFIFRTNASGSSLQLQTEGANRVYTDGSEATMGAGSTISFQVPAGVNSNIVKGMLDGIRVVFFNTADGTVYGVARATSATASEAADGTITWVGKLELCSYAVNAVTGYVSVGNALESPVLCGLNQNQPQRVSAMVSLDGNDITNADILAEGNLSGTLNLQFSSSAELVPMENSALKTMKSYDVTIGGTKVDTVEQGGTYTYTIDAATKEIVDTVEVKMGDSVQNGVYNGETGVITVPNVSGDITITITKQKVETRFTTDGNAAIVYGDVNELVKGSEHTFTVSPAEGYEISTVTYTPYDAEGTAGAPVILNATGENEYKISAQLTMVSKFNVHVTTVATTPTESTEG